MTLTFLMLGGAVLGIRTAPPKLVELAGPAPTSPDTNLISVPTLAAAEDLLDHLESHGATGWVLVIRDDGTFAVRRA